jgi:DNA-binding response OmpR family regulator
LALGKEEYEFYQYYCLAEIKDAEKMDLLILDLNLPDGNGLEYLREFRKVSQVPVLILTANDTEMDEVMGLKLGADDYVTKPFSLMVLRLRVQKLLARKSVSAVASDVPDVYEKKELYFDFERLIFKKNGQEIELSKTELRLLRCFVENEGITLTREKLISYVWQDQDFVEENALSVAMKRLRDKLEDRRNKYIHTVYGIGYIWKWGECDV